MTNNVGIWIDHKKAVIVCAPEGGVTVKTMHADGLAHPHYGGQQDGGGEQKYEERHRHRLDQYYDEVIGELGRPEALLIFGPGEAKVELRTRLSQSTLRPQPHVDIEAADKLTDPEIVAKVTAHFRTHRT